ncbi:hypothetical protein L249_8331, partial [Ophiocordyceps polyrhachis-furcata BCC 54312]
MNLLRVCHGTDLGDSESPKYASPSLPPSPLLLNYSNRVLFSVKQKQNKLAVKISVCFANEEESSCHSSLHSRYSSYSSPGRTVELRQQGEGLLCHIVPEQEEGGGGKKRRNREKSRKRRKKRKRKKRRNRKKREGGRICYQQKTVKDSQRLYVNHLIRLYAAQAL